MTRHTSEARVGIWQRIGCGIVFQRVDDGVHDSWRGYARSRFPAGLASNRLVREMRPLIGRRNSRHIALNQSTYSKTR